MSADALYVDASAAVKLFVDETSSEIARAALTDASELVASRLLYTEVGSAIARRVDAPEGEHAQSDWDDMWSRYRAIDLDQQIASHALGLAVAHNLGTLDAIHLASVLRIPAVPIKFATWDRALWDAARAVGLRTVPHDRP